MQQIADEAGFRIYGLRTRSLSPESRPLYLSAGCHGDEPAAVLGLLEWAEENVSLLMDNPFVLLPCLNPWGLVNNVRHNHGGNDLNRLFHDESHPVVSGWRAFIDGLHFPVAATMHEDYDANGIYLYELNPTVGHSYGKSLMAKCEKVIPREWRTSIEGRKAPGAIVRRTRGIPKLDGMPEAVTLFAEQGGVTLTFETPSEFSLHDRVAAQKCFIDALLEATRQG